MAFQGGTTCSSQYARLPLKQYAFIALAVSFRGGRSGKRLGSRHRRVDAMPPGTGEDHDARWPASHGGAPVRPAPDVAVRRSLRATAQHRSCLIRGERVRPGGQSGRARPSRSHRALAATGLSASQEKEKAGACIRAGLTRHIPGMGSTSMISTPSPGKIEKCGCFSNSFAAASCDSALMIV